MNVELVGPIMALVVTPLWICIAMFVGYLMKKRHGRERMEERSRRRMFDRSPISPQFSPGRFAVQQQAIGGLWVTVQRQATPEQFLYYQNERRDSFSTKLEAQEYAEKMQERGLRVRVVDRVLRDVLWPVDEIKNGY